MIKAIGQIFEQFQKRKGHPRLSLDGGFIYRIRLVGNTSPFLRFCVEDIFLRTADILDVGIMFVDSEPCDLCVVHGDTFLGHQLNNIIRELEEVHAPVIAFGIGTEIDLKQLNMRDRRRLAKALKKMAALSVRDQNISDYIHSIIKNTDICVIGEPIFSFQPIEIKRENTHITKIGIAVMNWKGMSEGEDTVYKKVSDYCNAVLNNEDTEIHLFCFSRSIEGNDEDVVCKIMANIKEKAKVHCHPYTADLLLTYSRLQKMDYMFSMRSTAGVAALLGQRPVVIMEKRAERGQEIFRTLKWTDFLISENSIKYSTLKEMFDLIENRSSNCLGQVNDLMSRWAKRQNIFSTQVLKKVLIKDYSLLTIDQ